MTTRLEEIEKRLAESDTGYYDWFLHDDLRALLDCAKALRPFISLIDLELCEELDNTELAVMVNWGDIRRGRDALAKLEATP